MMNVMGGGVSRDEVPGLSETRGWMFLANIEFFEFWHPLLPFHPLPNMTSSVRSLGCALVPELS
jgi:hypothetical protein